MSKRPPAHQIENLGRTRKWQLLRNSGGRYNNRDDNEPNHDGVELPTVTTDGMEDEIVVPENNNTSGPGNMAFNENQPTAVEVETQASETEIIFSPEGNIEDDSDSESGDSVFDTSDPDTPEDESTGNETEGDEDSEQINVGVILNEENKTEHIKNGDLPLYEGAPITLADSLLAILTLNFAHNLTASCLGDLLELISLHCKRPNLCRDTLYKFRNIFKTLKTAVVRHYYCENCWTQLKDENSVCDCGTSGKPSFFIEMPVEEQLCTLFRRDGFYDDLQHRFQRKKKVEGNFEDIYDGQIYQKYFQPGGFLSDKNNVSFSWYSDGIPIFKSRKYSVWPVYLIVNELPYQKRIAQQNTIVASLWFGSSEPQTNLFLKPLHSTFDRLYAGISVRIPGNDIPLTVRGLLLAGMADTPARCDFMCHTRFNGDYGCLQCLEKGYTIRGENFGNTHIYPFEGDVKLRTSKLVNKHALQALQQEKPVYGVKGPSVLSKIMPDAVRGFAIDIMHSIYLGVVKRLMKLWFDVKFRNEVFSLYQYVIIVDARLASIKPPSYVQRSPRSIVHDLCYFKANEFKPLLFYYLPVILRDLMLKPYFNHFKKLVSALGFLCAESTSNEQIVTANELLVAFVSQFQALYDPRFMSINVHMLLHLPKSVRDLGPLWVTSCFPWEDLNGKLIKMVHGTRHVGLQLHSAVAHGLILPYLVSQLPESKTKSFCERLLSKNKKQKLTAISEDFSIVGKIVECDNVSNELKNILGERNYVNIRIFHRLRKRRVVYYSSDYNRLKSKFSHCISYKDNRYKNRFGFIKMFLCLCNCNELPCGENCSKEYFAVVKQGISTRCFSACTKLTIEEEEEEDLIPINFIYQFNSTDECVAVPIENLQVLCFFIKVNNECFVAKPVNTVENE